MKKWVLITIFMMQLIPFGCSSYSINRTQNPSVSPLDRKGSAYVAQCADGRSDTRLYRGSGMAVTRTIMDNLSRYLEKISKGNHPETDDEALKTALSGGHTYLFCPSIVQWENHYTEKTEIPDRISIKINVIETLTGKRIDSTVINGKSRGMTRGGERPEDLLATPIRIYVDALFQ